MGFKISSNKCFWYLHGKTFKLTLNSIGMNSIKGTLQMPVSLSPLLKDYKPKSWGVLG